MSLGPLIGHDDTRAALARAVRAGELPGSLLIHGPRGVGKQRLALWLAQMLVCERPTDSGPCDACTACRHALRLEHPDVHWFFPLPRPKGASGDRLPQALEDARAEALAERRAAPWSSASSGEPVGYYVATIQTVRRQATTRPAMGARQVFIVGDAELLVPQESSPEAANALLKLLEEPPPATVFLLTASDPEALLPTIRSRLLAVRLRAMPESAVVDYLVRERGLAQGEAALAARLGQGAIGRALAFRAAPGEEGPLAELRLRARDLLAGAAAPDAARRYGAALATAPAAARGSFSDLLDLLALWLRDLAATAAGTPELVVNRDGVEFLEKIAARAPNAAAGAAEAVRVVEEALELAQGNVNPQLVLASTLRRIHEALAGTPAGAEPALAGGRSR